MSNTNEDLGLPESSERAERSERPVKDILAIIIAPVIVLASIALMFLMFWIGEYASSLAILTGLTAFAGSVIGYYFARKATNEIIKSHKNTLETQRNIFEREIQTHREIIASRDREIETHREIIASRDREISRIQP